MTDSYLLDQRLTLTLIAQATGLGSPTIKMLQSLSEKQCYQAIVDLRGVLKRLAQED